MSLNLWFFLSVCVVFGVVFTMFAMFIDHLKKMKILEIEALKTKYENKQAEVDKKTS